VRVDEGGSLAQGRSGPCLVIKIGGSLAEDPALTGWLEAIVRLDMPAVIVPGGGPYLELVRASRARWHFDDVVALRMALIGMQQYGTLMRVLAPALAPCAALDHIGAALARGSTAVWLPDARSAGTEVPILAAEPNLDSLAAWLAGRLRAPGLVLVKSSDLPDTRDDLGVLAESGVVDTAFVELLGDRPCRVLVLYKSEHQRLAEARAAALLAMAGANPA
jgi:aspartokinase-like uncharacterized kinase